MGAVRRGVGVEYGPRDLGTVHAVRDGDPRLLGERLLQPPLHGEADEEGRNEEREVESPAAHVLRIVASVVDTGKRRVTTV